MEEIASAAQSRRVGLGVYRADIADAPRFISLGHRLITPGNDIAMLRHAAEARLTAIRASR